MVDAFAKIAAAITAAITTTAPIRGSDVEGSMRGQLAAVVVVVLGRVGVDVGDSHDVSEIGIPSDREMHGERERAL
jgi:hypothetical protein